MGHSVRVDRAGRAEETGDDLFFSAVSYIVETKKGIGGCKVQSAECRVDEKIVVCFLRTIITHGYHRVIVIPSACGGGSKATGCTACSKAGTGWGITAAVLFTRDLYQNTLVVGGVQGRS